MFANNLSLNQFSAQLSDYPLPPGTVKVAMQSVCGKLNGNGNGMDFAAILLVRSDLSVNELRQYYSNAGFGPVKGDKGYICELEVSEPDSNVLNSSYVENQEVVFRQLSGLVSYQGYYFILIYDGGYDAAFDVRGH